MITLYWYESHATVGLLKTALQTFCDEGMELAVRVETESVLTLLEHTPVKSVIYESCAERLQSHYEVILTMRQKWPEVKWVALMDKDWRLPDAAHYRELVFSGFDEFLEFDPAEPERLMDRLGDPRHLYERREALGLDGVVDHERFEEISRILEDQPVLVRREADKLMQGIHVSEKNKLKKTFEQAFKVTQQVPMQMHHRLKLCVFGNSEYGCELGWVFSKKLGKKTLIMDVDRLFPSLDVLLEVRKTVPNPIEGYDTLQSTGLNILLDAVRKNQLTSDRILEACVKVKGNPDLYALTGSYNLNDYEYYDKEDFMKLLERVDACFEVVIILTNAFIYDVFTAVSLLVSDRNLIPLVDGVLPVRSAATAAAYVSERQRIDPGKHLFIAFDLHEKQQLSTEDYETLTGTRFLGKIPAHSKRGKARREGRMYGPMMDKSIVEAHERIIQKLSSEMRG